MQILLEPDFARVTSQERCSGMEVTMNHFGTLYHYEWKKLLRKKIVWISFISVFFMLAIAVFSPLFGSYYIEGKYMGTTYEMDQIDQGYAQALNGRTIDKDLMTEAITAYRKIPRNLDVHYSITEEFQTYARPYSEIFGFIKKCLACRLRS